MLLDDGDGSALGWCGRRKWGWSWLLLLDLVLLLLLDDLLDVSRLSGLEGWNGHWLQWELLLLLLDDDLLLSGLLLLLHQNGLWLWGLRLEGRHELLLGLLDADQLGLRLGLLHDDLLLLRGLVGDVVQVHEGLLLLGLVGGGGWCRASLS